MSLSRTLKFFAVVIALLAILCIVLPEDGVRVAGTTIRMPSLHKVLVREKERDIDELLAKPVERDLTGIRDSILDCRYVTAESQYRFWLPNDDVSFFDNFFKQAESAVKKHRIIRVLHYGDSQIEQDRISCRLRSRLQREFGGGGPGMLPFRQPIPTLTINQSAKGDIHGQAPYGDSTYSRNGNYGPMLRSWHLGGFAGMSVSRKNSMYADSCAGSFSSVRLLFNNRGSQLSVSMKNRKGAGSYYNKVNQPGIGVVSWNLDTVTSSVCIDVRGNADLYGVMVDNGYGVAVDNISMRGVSGHQFKKTKLEQLTDSYKLMDVGMIIMQFGGNSMSYLVNERSINKYCEDMGAQIDYLRLACPDVTILFVGPSDMSTTKNGRRTSYKQIPEVVKKLRKTVNEHGAAYWSIYDAMGGFESMVSWVNNKLAGNDYTHFTVKGAILMGDCLSDALLKMYELYKLRKQITPIQFNKLWKDEETTLSSQ